MLKNYEAIAEELKEMMIRFDVDGNQYQTDVYLYIDEDGNGRLDEFVNVGGNSWLDDDHIVVYIDKPHYEDRDPDISDEEYEDMLREAYGIDYMYNAYDYLDEALKEEE